MSIHNKEEIVGDPGRGWVRSGIDCFSGDGLVHNTQKELLENKPANLSIS